MSRIGFKHQSLDELATCTPVVTELWFGAQKVLLRSGSDRYFLAFERVANEVVQGRILPFDVTAATICGRLRAEREAIGRSIYILDAMIAAICMANGATLATRNAKDFEGLDLKVVNPFEPS